MLYIYYLSIHFYYYIVFAIDNLILSEKIFEI